MIKEDIKEQGESWWSIQLFNFGMNLRNMLRKGGFDWDNGAIDRYWTDITGNIKSVEKDVAASSLI